MKIIDIASQIASKSGNSNMGFSQDFKVKVRIKTGLNFNIRRDTLFLSPTNLLKNREVRNV